MTVWSKIGVSRCPQPGAAMLPAVENLRASSATSAIGVRQFVNEGNLPLDPTGAPDMPPLLSFNTAVSFITGTNWQAYEGETAASYLAQMAGLVIAQFTAAAVGLSVALAVVRGIARSRRTVGNFITHVQPHRHSRPRCRITPAASGRTISDLMKQCSRPKAGTTSQQRSTLPVTGRGTIFHQGSKPRTKKCSPAGGHQVPSLPDGGPAKTH
jgi:Potassium-transporting ATPase A subunit